MQTRLDQMRSGVRGAGLAVAMLLIAAVLGFGARGVFAQESTPTAEDATGAETTEATEASEADAAYDEFVAGLATNLGVDTATVEAAITQTLTDMVAAKLAAGEISADEAAALTEEIASGERPFRVGLFGGHDGRGGFGAGDRDGRDGPGGRGDRNDSDDSDSTDDTTDGVGGGTTDEADPAGTPVTLT